MIELNLEKPIFNKYLFHKLMIKRIKLEDYGIIRKNLNKIINELARYFVNNFDRFLTLSKLLNLKGINLRLIDYYCHKFQKKWYQKLCQKYGTRYSYMPALTCFLIGEKIKVNIKNVYIELSFANLIFYKHLFEDGLYSDILFRQDYIRNHINSKNQIRPVSPVNLEKRNKILQINNKLLIPFEFDNNKNKYVSTKKINFDHQIEGYCLLSLYQNGFKIRGFYPDIQPAVKKLELLENNDVTLYQQISIINVIKKNKTKKYNQQKSLINRKIVFSALFFSFIFYFIYHFIY